MPSHKIVGKVTEEERDEIKNLYSKKTSLESLFHSLLASKIEVKNTEIYDKLIKDYSDVTMDFQNWWPTKTARYNWESVDGGNWSIDFDTCDVVLNYP
jgi:CXXX repeat modification system protein